MHDALPYRAKQSGVFTNASHSLDQRCREFILPIQPDPVGAKKIKMSGIDVRGEDAMEMRQKSVRYARQVAYSRFLGARDPLRKSNV